MATLPYNPTKLLSSPTSNDTVYILQPGDSAGTHLHLLALNASKTLGSTNLPYSTISPTVPFLDSSQNGSYTSAIDQDGNILVYAGVCDDTDSSPTFWRFTPTNIGGNMNGTWKQEDLNTQDLHSSSITSGANYLTSAIAFSTTANVTSELYVFGGMCPTSTDTSIDNWTQAANYSNSMLTIKSASPQDAESTFDLDISPSRGPPVAEAGFSITPLQPTFFNSGSNNAFESQNQNFVLIGGHTQQAFINMSQVALFSLPEQSWTFLPVDSPSPEADTELAVRNQATIDSRSGHTALLSSDGKRVILFGGWVGDVNTSADPQLAVLELGEGYGGSGDWQWNIPNPTGSGLAPGSGLFGHGATMLAGDIMMIIGGYQIPSNNAKRKRSGSSISTNTYYLNTSSNSWIATYTHPIVSASHGSATSANGKGTSSEKKIGLGVGLVLGVLAILALISFYVWYSRRLKPRRNAREEELRQLAISPHTHRMSGQAQSAPGRRASEMSTVDWTGDNHFLSRDTGPYPSGRHEPEAERTGLLFEIPSPTRGLRRSLHSRGAYQPTLRFDDGRRTPGFSTIHPIDERDEYDEDRIDGSTSGQHEMMQRDDYNVITNVPVLDPFQDPMSGSRTPSPQSPQDRELEIRNWINDWTAADTLMHSQAGRISPEKTDRTSSTLSDQSARSGLSSHSIQRSAGSISRSFSQRSAALFNATPFRSNTPVDVQHVQHAQQGAAQRYHPEHRRARSLSLQVPAQRDTKTESYANTASSFAQLQSEGEALLGDYPPSGEPSPTKAQHRARGWMGSVRRALTGAERSTSASPENNDSTSSSPTKSHHGDGSLPRRAASTGGMFWQRKQGARDWDVEGRGRDGDNHEVHAQDNIDDDWDVESAVERRVVQVMFTVPKEKLRVVNRGPDGDAVSMTSADIRDTGDGSEEPETETGKGKGKEKEGE